MTMSEIFKPNPVPKPTSFEEKFCILCSGQQLKPGFIKILMNAAKKSQYSKFIQLIFIGNFNHRDKIERWSRKNLGSMALVTTMNTEDLASTINYCDIYCQPASKETDDLACRQAICAGLVPLVPDSRKCASRKLILDSKSLFKPGNSSDLAARIDWFIEHPLAKRSISQEYIALWQHFTQEFVPAL